MVKIARSAASPTNPRRFGGLPRRRDAVSIALVYALLGTLWIFVSGYVLHASVVEPEIAARFENVKGTGFVIVTALLLALGLDRFFAVIRRSAHLVQERERELETKFLQAQKLEAVGRLAGGVAHDFNNMLAVILAQCDLGLSDCEKQSDTEESFTEIKNAAERAAKLTRQLLSFSRRQVMQPQALDLNQAIKSLGKMLKRLLGEDVDLLLTLHEAPLWIHADGGMLDQVLMNLAVNARDAMPQGGRLTIATGEQVLSEAEAAARPGAAAGRYAWIRVQDNGCGIPLDVQPHIFEPFFTTKALGKGTGLGLASVLGIVQQHHGWLEMESQPGQGAAFMVLLPIVPPTEDRAPAVVTHPASSGSETVLLVEDEVLVRRAARTILQRHGYDVREAAHGREALEMVRTSHAPFHLLLTDMVLPEGLGGSELANKLRALRPEIKVVYMSGYSAGLGANELVLRPGDFFIQKPFDSSSMVAVIRKCLDS